jgi:ATP-dependent RNA helicase RhlB
MIKAFFIQAGKKLRQLTSKKVPELRPAEGPQETPAQEEAPQKSRRRRSSKVPRAAWTPANFQVEPLEGQSRFHDFSFPDSLLHGIADVNFQYCTPIQAKALPLLLEGKDIMAKAATGTGKSAVFLLGIFAQLLQEAQATERKSGCPQALILAPTRELVLQIAQEGKALAQHSSLRILAVYGGTDYQKQEHAFAEGPVDVVVATPGRLLDYVSRKTIQLHQTRILVFDEADRMLDMGFIPDVRRIVSKIRPKDQRQTLLFSATLTEEIKHLAAQWCVHPIYVESNPEEMAVDTVTQIVYTATSEEKYPILYHLLTGQEHQRVIVFTNMKSEAARLHERLDRNGIASVLMTGDVPQQKRMSRLERFRKDPKGIMIATDVAGRGIHIDGISHVVNYSLPNEPEDYVHRIGRTGRAGESGLAISFACEEGAFCLPEIEVYLGKPLACILPPEELLHPVPPLQARKKKEPKQGQRGGQGSRPRRKTVA